MSEQPNVEAIRYRWQVAYYTGIHRYSFRAGQKARIISVLLCLPLDSRGFPSGDWRPCFKVEWPDVVVDYVPVSETHSYRIGSREEDFEVTE
jgi:hypothetical protein